MYRGRIIACIGFFFFALAVGFGQESNYLNKKVTLSLTNVSLKMVFDDVAHQTGCVFSYSNIDDQQVLSLSADNLSLKKTLNRIKRATDVEFKNRGKYIIVKLEKTPKKQDQFLTGSIYDEENNPIQEASIYIKNRRLSTLSSNNGSFSLKIPHDIESLKLSIAKENFVDTSMIVVVSAKQPLSIKMTKFYVYQPISSIDPVESVIDSLESKQTIPALEMAVKKIPVHSPLHENDEQFWDRLRRKNSHLKNIKDTLLSDFSFSFIPPISTNGLLAFNTKNRFSFNVLAGYTKGVTVAEFGGLVNVDNGDVGVLQLGGLANIVTGKVKGFQAAGLYNSVGNDFNGLQMGGIYNHVGGKVTGVQMGGIFSRVSDVDGLQLNGIVSMVTDSIIGGQFSGISSYATNVDGIQASGIIGIVGDTLIGGQFSGILNGADRVNGIQAAGILNFAQEIKGAQVAGILNTADTVSGFQIGLFNYANHYSSGGPIGLFSFVKSGYHKFEFSYDDLQFASIGFRTGVRRLHTHFFAGINYTYKEPLFNFGLGIASSIPISKKLFFEADLSTKHLTRAEHSSLYFNAHNVAFLGLSFQLTKSIGVRFGPTANLFVSERGSDFADVVTDFIPNRNYERNSGSLNSRGWFGFKASLLLF